MSSRCSHRRAFYLFVLLCACVILLHCDLNVRWTWTIVTSLKIQENTYASQPKSRTLSVDSIELLNKERKTPRRPFLKSSNDIYLYSAINNLGGDQNDRNVIAVSGWHRGFKTDLSKITFRCCYLLGNGRFTYKYSAEKSLSRSPKDGPSSDYLNAIQYYCPALESSFPKTIGIAIRTTKEQCNKDTGSYLVPETIHKKRERGNEIVVCSKLHYGSLNASRLIEWFEAVKYVGIDRVLAYKHKLNVAAANVLSHYEAKGFVTTFDFVDLPEKDRLQREVGDKVNAAFDDEQVVIFDCQERMRAYSTAGFLDADEFLLPRNETATLKRNFLKQYLEEHLSETPTISGIMFPIKYHVTSWNASNNHPLFIGQYLDTTGDMSDTVKYFYNPDRIKHGSCFAHFFTPKKGLTMRVLEDSHGHLVIHHFRSARSRWIESHDVFRQHKSYRDDLFEHRFDIPFVDFKRYVSKNTLLLANAIQQDVLDIRRSLGL